MTSLYSGGGEHEGGAGAALPQQRICLGEPHGSGGQATVGATAALSPSALTAHPPPEDGAGAVKGGVPGL